MALKYDDEEIKKEDQHQKRDDPILLDLKRRKPWHAALQNLIDVGAPPRLLLQAEGNPRLALVNPKAKTRDELRELSVVQCVLWNGTTLPSCTVDFVAKTNCKIKFGWEAKEEKDAVYKYSKNLEQDPDKEPLFDWIQPPNISGLTKRDPKHGEKDGEPKMDSLKIGAGSDLENTQGVANWKSREYQRIFWFSMIVRELLPEEHKKTGAIDTYKVFLPAESAKTLLKFVAKGQCGLMDELRDWLERSIKAGQAEGS